MVPAENPTITTLKRAFSSLSDYCLHSFNQSAAHLQHKWSQLDQHYNLTSTTADVITSTSKTLLHLFNQLPSPSDMQQKWSQVDQQYNLTATTADVITRLITAVDLLFKQSTHFFNNVLTAEMVARVVIVVLILIVCALVVIWVCRFVGFVIRLLYLFISSIVSFLFRLVSVIVKVVLSVVSCLRQCLWFGGKATVKMMKAPGKPAVMIARTLFEANPQEYFSNLRGGR